MQVLDEFSPMTAGMSCYKCKSDLRKESPTGKPGHEKAVDTGVSIDYEGALALCESCVVEMASELGMVLPEKITAANLERDMADALAENYRRDLEDATEGMRAMARVLLPEAHQSDSPAVVEISAPIKRGPGRPKASA